MIINCNICGATINESKDRCLTCGEFAGYPNVRAASSSEEEQALARRYEEVVKQGKDRGCMEILAELEEELKKSFAVVACDLFFVRQLIINQKTTLYSNYHMAVSANIRKPSEEVDDQERRFVDARLFGAYGQEIIFAVLSLSGRGLKSYGAYFLTLRDIAVAARATVLEENSFVFVEKRCTSRDGAPPGYRTTWQKRHKLGIAKLGRSITQTTQRKDFADLVLSDGHDRRSDNFLEVHIYGPFDGNAIEAVAGKAHPEKIEEAAVASVLKEYLLSSGRRWIDL